MRTFIKKVVFKLLGQKSYEKAYAKGKIYDINKGNLIEPEIDFLEHFISPDSTVLDIGANYGHYAIIMARLASTGNVYAFEPIPFTYNVLERITKHFSQKNILLHHAAVSDTESVLKMNVPLLDFGAPNTGVAYIGDSTETKSKTFEVNSVVLDNLEINGKLDFIKIDIEGHEQSAFRGMKNLLQLHSPIVLIEFSFPCLRRAGVEPNEFSNELISVYGYEFYSVKEDKLVKVNESPGDGYYFLIPQKKVTNYKDIIA